MEISNENSKFTNKWGEQNYEMVVLESKWMSLKSLKKENDRSQRHLFDEGVGFGFR